MSNLVRYLLFFVGGFLVGREVEIYKQYKKLDPHETDGSLAEFLVGGYTSRPVVDQKGTRNNGNMGPLPPLTGIDSKSHNDGNESNSR